MNTATQDGQSAQLYGVDLRPGLASHGSPATITRTENLGFAALIYTSGSTGRPKGGAIAVNFLAAVWPYLTYGADMRADDVVWPTGDPGWGYGFVCYLGALAMGRPLCRWRPIRRPRCAWMCWRASGSATSRPRLPCCAA
ncbi:acetyl-CoA synthetase [Bordetella pertussis]|nr:acetyl-CoA synthetase [Bordetella pertussis]